MDAITHTEREGQKEGQEKEKVIIVPYEPWHFDLVEPREHEKKCIELFGDMAEVVRGYAECSSAFTALYGGEVLGIGGILLLWEGVGEAWLYSSPKWDSHAVTMARQIKRYLEVIMSSMDLHRVQAAVKKDYKRAERFIEFLGFENEGLMRQYGEDKADHTRYARIIV